MNCSIGESLFSVTWSLTSYRVVCVLSWGLYFKLHSALRLQNAGSSIPTAASVGSALPLYQLRLSAVCRMVAKSEDKSAHFSYDHMTAVWKQVLVIHCSDLASTQNSVCVKCNLGRLGWFWTNWYMQLLALTDLSQQAATFELFKITY